MKKKIVRIASTVFPKAVASFAYNQLINPQVRKLREHELATLDKATKEIFPFEGFDIRLYAWGSGDTKVLLIHGWEGQAGNFSDLIEELVLNDFAVYSFDAPSHGFSSKGKTSLFEFSDLVGVLIRKYDVRLLVSHSFGGVATTYALFRNPDLVIGKYVLLTTPDAFIERINNVSETVGISPKVKKILIDRLESEMGLEVENLNVRDFVKSINVKQALIIHDKNDRVIPIERSKRVHENWKVSELKEIEGTGHFRILRTKEVIKQVVEYLKKRD
ncbi:MAG: alpha/beta hydrolase [Bacteroidota bacterium]